MDKSFEQTGKILFEYDKHCSPNPLLFIYFVSFLFILFFLCSLLIFISAASAQVVKC